jgi:tRNA-specific 2-thiouridylase
MAAQTRIAVAMSGGVDSSVAAARLVRQGLDVIGMTMDLFSLSAEYCRDPDLQSCCGREAADQAQAAARALGIDFYPVDLRAEFAASVIEDFRREYAAGRTPNPCIRCNERIKFEALRRRAAALGAGLIATGHHARVRFEKSTGRYLLLKGRDRQKDQSYFLYGLSQSQLAAALFPVGGMTKSAVRSFAREHGLPTAARRESQEICFIPNNDYIGFLKDRFPELFFPGPIKDLEGRILGTHKGIIHFTIGQRRGIGVSAPQPLYVVEIRAGEHTVVVGRDRDLYRDALLAGRVNWVAFETLDRPREMMARIRYRHREAPATATPLHDGTVRVEFADPQRAVTPGQSVVFYEEDLVLGGGVIEAALDRL